MRVKGGTVTSTMWTGSAGLNERTRYQRAPAGSGKVFLVNNDNNHEAEIKDKV